MNVLQTLKPALLALTIGYQDTATTPEPTKTEHATSEQALDGKLAFPSFQLEPNPKDFSRLMLARVPLTTQERQSLAAFTELGREDFENLPLDKQIDLMQRIGRELGTISEQGSRPADATNGNGSALRVANSYLRLLKDPDFRALDTRIQQTILDVLSELTDSLANDAELLSKVNSRGAIASVWALNRNFEEGVVGERPFLLGVDSNGTMLIEHIKRLLSLDDSSNARMLALDLILDLAEPHMAARQTTYPDCPAAAIQAVAVSKTPTEYGRQVIEYYLTGETTFTTGVRSRVSKQFLDEKHFAKRSMSSTIFQSALIQHGRGDSVLDAGLDTEQLLNVLSDYFGGSFQIAQGGAEILDVLKKAPETAVIMGFGEYESVSSHGHVVGVLGCQGDRLLVSDSNGNFGLRPSFRNLEEALLQAPKGEYYWQWADGTTAGTNPLPDGIIGLNVEFSSGVKKLLFLDTKSPQALLEIAQLAFLRTNEPAYEKTVPPPHFERKSPDRRLEEWSSGLWSMDRDALNRADPLYFLQEEVVKETVGTSSRIFSSMQKLQEEGGGSGWTSYVTTAGELLGLWFVLDRLATKFLKRWRESKHRNGGQE